MVTLATFSQNGRIKPAGVINGVDKVSQKFLISATEPENTAAQKRSTQNPEITNPAPQAQSTATASGTWSMIGGSRNIFSVLVSHSKPLNYNHNVNAVSFVHRVSSTYTTTPDNSGSMMAHITTDWGFSWDSTAFWANATEWARYPQGGIYSAPGNTNIANAYIVGMGPVTNSSGGWHGNWYASKKLGTGFYNNTPDNAPNAQQYFPNTSATGSLLAHDFSRYSFTSTDDGLVRSIGLLTNDVNVAGNLPGDTGLYVVTGSFNAGTFNWSGTTFVPPVVVESGGTHQLLSYGYMAWNQAGTVGYVVAIGARAGVTVTENKGYQPIVYKTTNSGASWSLLSGIDFSSPSFSAVTYPLAPIGSNSNIAIPFFNFNEGIDVAVDENDKLHIVSTIVGTSSDHPDTLGFIYSFTNIDGESYRWPHSPGARPFIYDFVGDGTSWSYKLIDSLSSEVPASRTTGAGYSSNPWDADASNNNTKVSSSARIQLGRTPNGSHLVYSWAESDTNYTNNSIKWNVIPDIKARVLTVGTNSLTNEVNVSKLGAGTNGAVLARSMFHYMSPTTSSVVAGQVTVPITVSNSNPYSQLTSNIHWYISAKLDVPEAVGIKENNNQNSAINSVVYPNPTNGNAVVSVNLKDNEKLSVTVYNTIGQIVKSINAEGHIGENNVELNLNNLTSGIYLVNIKAGNATGTKKLIIE